MADVNNFYNRNLSDAEKALYKSLQETLGANSVTDDIFKHIIQAYDNNKTSTDTLGDISFTLTEDELKKILSKVHDKNYDSELRGDFIMIRATGGESIIDFLYNGNRVAYIDNEGNYVGKIGGQNSEELGKNITAILESITVINNLVNNHIENTRIHLTEEEKDMLSITNKCFSSLDEAKSFFEDNKDKDINGISFSVISASEPYNEYIVIKPVTSPYELQYEPAEKNALYWRDINGEGSTNFLKVVQCTKLQYTKLTIKDDNTLYFCSDTNEIYKGNIAYGVDNIVVTDKASFYVLSSFEVGKLYIITESDNLYDLCISLDGTTIKSLKTSISKDIELVAERVTNVENNVNDIASELNTLQNDFAAEQNKTTKIRDDLDTVIDALTWKEV